MATRALGTKLQIGASTILGLKSIGGVDVSAETIDTTDLETSDGYKTFIGGFKDGGEVSCSGNFLPDDTTGQKAFWDLLGTGAVTQFIITFPSTMGATWTFNGVVTGFSTNADLEDLITFDGKIKVSGAPVLAITATADLTTLACGGTGGTLTPSYASGTYKYAFTGVTAASVTVTPTLATATIRLYVDGVYVENVTSGQASSPITLSIAQSKLVTLIVSTAGKAQKYYDIVIHKVS